MSERPSPPPPGTAGAALGAWLLGTCGPIHAVVGQSVRAQRASVAIAVAMLAFSWAAGAGGRARLSRVARWLVLTATVVAAEVVAQPLIGRAPALVAAAGVALACWFADLDRPADATGRVQAGWVGLALVAGSQVLWSATGSLATVGATFALATALAVAEALGRRPLAGVDAGIGRGLERAWLATSAGVAALGSGATRTGARSVEVAGRGASATAEAATRLGTRTSEAARRVPVDQARHAAASTSRRSVGWLREQGPGLLVAAAMGLLSAPLWWALAGPAPQFQGEIDDLPNHIFVSHQFQLWPPHTYSPHVLFAMAVRLASLTLADRAAGTFVLSCAYAATGWVLYRIVRRPIPGHAGAGRWGATVLPLAMLVCESPMLLRRVGSGIWDRPAFDPIGSAPQMWVLHTWASPTSVLLLPFALALVAALADLTWSGRGDGVRPAPSTWSIAVLTVLATAAKPALTLVIVPALPILWLLLPERRQMPWRAAIWGLVVPGAAITVAQMAFLASGVNPEEHTKWRWDPFWLWRLAQQGRPLVWIPIVVPIAAVAIARRAYVRDLRIQLLALCMLISIVPTYLLRETGTHASHANLAWTMIISLICFELFTVDVLVRHVPDAIRAGRARGALATAALVVLAIVGMASVAAGIWHYLVLLHVVRY